MNEQKKALSIPLVASIIAVILGVVAVGLALNAKDSKSSSTSAPTTMDTMQHSSSTMSAEEMDKMMKKPTDKFLELATKKGNVENTQWMEPKILSDGTKEFDLTASIFDWEVSPGKIVKAWGYNKQVPGPNIRTNIGDKVKIVLKNELKESTVIHFHGVKGLPNTVDGVPDVTQPPVKPGKSYTYEFTTNEASVGMYHSHHNAQVQVPNGLAGTFLVGDMPTPNGEKVAQEIPMMLNDAGTIGLSLNGKSFPGTKAVVAKEGEYLKVHYLNEGAVIHPMHTHGFEQLVIARDGAPLKTPYAADTVTVAPGERVTVLIRLTQKGAWAWHCHILTHAEGPQGMFGMVTAIVVQ
ncbi:MAG: multicopper oxidase domain-containing protein [Acidimicrobiia bacterium]